MKYIFLTDSHLKSTPPVCRSDDFEDSIFYKLNQVINLADSLPNFGGIIHGGDLFDNPQASYRLVHRLHETIRSVWWYQCIGQHDVWGHNLDLSTVPIGMLEIDDAFVVLDSALDTSGVKKGILGYFLPGIEEEPVKDFIDWVQSVECGIMVVHGMIANRSLPFDYLDAKSVLDHMNPGTLMLCGDWHESFVLRDDKNHKMIVNPGPFARLTAKDYNDPVRILIIDADEEGIWTQVKQKSLKRVEFQPILTGISAKLEPMMEAFIKELSGYEETNLSLEEIKGLLARLGKDMSKEVVEMAYSYLTMEVHNES